MPMKQFNSESTTEKNTDKIYDQISDTMLDAPLHVSLAHKLAVRLEEVRKDGTLGYLMPDGETQVIVEYGENDKPKRVDTIVVSAQYDNKAGLGRIREDIVEEVIDKVIPHDLMVDTKIFINPTGRIAIGEPIGDTGLTCRYVIEGCNE